MVDTRRSNADAHPGLVLVNDRKKRRTKKQIKDDEARAKADAIANRAAIKAREREILARIVASEDTVQREDDALQAYATRPDLRHDSQESQPSNPKRRMLMYKSAKSKNKGSDR